jgi:TolB protein
MFPRIALLALLLISCAIPFIHAQETPPIVIRPRPSEEIILAVAEAQPASLDNTGETSETIKTFNQVLWDDLTFSGSFTMAGKSYYPPQPIRRPTDVNYDAWNSLFFKVSYLSAGTLEIKGGSLHAEMSIYDMKQQRPIFGTSYDGSADQVRAVAHRWADEVVYQLTAGASKGIATTKIAYVVRKGNAKEIYIMDYDGYNPQAFTHSGTLNLFPNWAPDNSKLAFTSLKSLKWEINVYSYIDGSLLRFPAFNSFASTPAISPDGTEAAFSLRTPRGLDTDLYISKLDGTGRHDITNNPAIDNAPTWSPSGKQLAFESDREGGVNQIYICDADGANVRRIIKEGGDANSPAWSPDGRWIAFHWKPHLSTRYDIFLAEVSSGKIRQVTHNSGSNESPSWAPDSRHLVFQSNRNGSTQIYIMLLDDSEPRMITGQGNNTSPAWSGYFQNKTVR